MMRTPSPDPIRIERAHSSAREFDPNHAQRCRNLALRAHRISSSKIGRRRKESDIETDALILRSAIVLKVWQHQLTTKGKPWLVRELPKNRRRTEVPATFSGSTSAIGRHTQNSENLERIAGAFGTCVRARRPEDVPSTTPFYQWLWRSK
jgi:hypothetical protein